MANMFSGKNDKQIPKTLRECVREDGTVNNLHLWAERLEDWGRILFFVLIIVGIIVTFANARETSKLLDEVYDKVSPAELAAAGVEIPSVFDVVINDLWTWGLYAFLEYCAYHVLALLVSALALITQNTIISADVALYESNRHNGNSEAGVADSRREATQKQNTVQAKTTEDENRTDKEAVVVKAEICNAKKICPKCGQIQKLDRTVCWSCGAHFEN